MGFFGRRADNYTTEQMIEDHFDSLSEFYRYSGHTSVGVSEQQAEADSNLEEK